MAAPRPCHGRSLPRDDPPGTIDLYPIGGGGTLRQTAGRYRPRGPGRLSRPAATAATVATTATGCRGYEPPGDSHDSPPRCSRSAASGPDEPGGRYDRYDCQTTAKAATAVEGSHDCRHRSTAAAVTADPA